MKDFAQILKSIGLQESEIKTYLAALKHGASTVVQLTKHTNLSRQAIYLAIDGMMERGLVSSVLHGKKRLFAAEPPEKLLAYAKRMQEEMHNQISEFEKALPELELQIGGVRPVVRLYEGKEGIRAFLEEVKKVKPKVIHEVADAEAVRKAMSIEDLAPYRRELARIKSRVKGIYSGALGPKPDSHTERVAIQDDYFRFPANISVLGDRVGFVSMEGKPYTVILENSSIAKTIEQLIELAFVEAKRRGKIS